MKRPREWFTVEVSIGAGRGRVTETRLVHIRLVSWLRWPVVTVKVVITSPPPGASWHAGISNRNGG